MKRLTIILGLMLALSGAASSPARALTLPNGVTIVDAGDLERDCVITVVLAEANNVPNTEADRMSAQYCAAYFSAVMDSLVVMSAAQIYPLGICYPAQPVAQVELIRAYIEYIGRHSERRRSFAMPSVMAALAERFPCDKLMPR